MSKEDPAPLTEAHSDWTPRETTGSQKKSPATNETSEEAFVEESKVIAKIEASDPKLRNGVESMNDD